MTWSELKADAGGEGVTASCSRYGGSSALRLVLCFSVEFARHHKLAAGDTLAVYIGHGEHDQRIMIEKKPGSAHRIFASSYGTLRIVIACPDYLPDAPRDPAACAVVAGYDAVDGGVAIAMPAWFCKDLGHRHDG